MAQHINKDDLKKIIKKIIKESVGIPSEENYYISVMVPRIKSWMDEVYQDWGGINAVSPEALTDFSNRNDYEESLDAFAHEFNVDREELRPAFDKAIEIAHSKLKEDLLGEAKFVNQFTPYTDDEKRTNFEYLRTGFGRSPEERNPAYAAAKKAAEGRRKQKEAQKQNGEVSETIHYTAERMAADNNYRMKWNEKYLKPLLDKCDTILNGSENASVQEIIDLYKRLNTIRSCNPIKYDVRLIELQDEIKDRLEKLVEFIRQMMTNRPNESKKRVNNQTLNCNRNMNKKLIRLKESDLHKIVKESVIRVLNEKLVYRNAKFYTPTPIPSDGGPMYNDTFAFKEFQKLIDGCNRQLKFPVLNRKQGIDASEFLIQQFENWVNEYGKYIVSNQPIGKLVKGSGIQNKFGKIEYVKGDGGYARIFADCVNSGTPYYDEVADTFDPYPDEEVYF